MAKRINYSKVADKAQNKAVQTCRTCEHARDYHEVSFATKRPFLCKCDFEEWSQFLDIVNKCKNYKKKGGIE